MWDPREDSYIQELAARIEALEAAQQLAGTDHAGWHRLSDVKPLKGAECLFRLHPNLLHSRGVWFDQSHSLTPSISPSGFYTDCGLFVGDPALIWWSAIEPEAQQPAPAAQDSSAAAAPAPDDRLRWCPTHGQQPRNAWGCPECVRELRAAAGPRAPAGVQRRYPSPATIAECGGPCDSQGPEACDCGLLQELNPPLPAPAGGLVKRVAHLLAMRFSESRPGTDCTPFACDVLREVAAAAEQMAPDKNLTWERVRLWLEVEANR